MLAKPFGQYRLRLSLLIAAFIVILPLGAGAASKAIEGWTNVTQPLNATGKGKRIDIGGGNMDHADLSTFDPGVLTPGSVVNIFNRGKAYKTNLLFHQSGTKENPIIVNGVTDAQGNRPEINCNGARIGHGRIKDWIRPNAKLGKRSGPPWNNNDWASGYGCWQLSFSRATDPKWDMMEWMEFRNLYIHSANKDAIYNDKHRYIKGASPIRISNGRHITFQGMIFENSGNGLFVAANVQNGPVIVRGSLFKNNGVPGSYLEHNVYVQSIGTSEHPDIFEGNHFGALKKGSRGASGIKHRGTNVVIRYNTLLCQARCFDVVEAQDHLPGGVLAAYTPWQLLTDYRAGIHIYGNQLTMDESRGVLAVYPIHIGMDTTQVPPDDQTFNPCCAGDLGGKPMARAHGAPALYYHNSHAYKFKNYFNGLFDTDAAGGGGESRHPGKIIAMNNVWSVRGTKEHYVTHMRYSGQVTYKGGNLIHVPRAELGTVVEGRDLRPDPNIEIFGSPTISKSQDPMFKAPFAADMQATNLSLKVGSPARGLAVPLEKIHPKSKGRLVKPMDKMMVGYIDVGDNAAFEQNGGYAKISEEVIKYERTKDTNLIYVSKRGALGTKVMSHYRGEEIELPADKVYPVDLQPVPASQGGGAIPRATAFNLGAFE